MKYIASDIVRHAKQLANIEDSAFTSYEEDVKYLNQAFAQMSQALINKGVHYFYRVRPLGSGDTYELPPDFYQMDCIRDFSGTLLGRHTPSMSNSTPSYDIIGNSLKVYGNCGSLELCYYTKPTWLTFPAISKKLSIPVDSIDGCSDTKIVWHLGNEIFIYDISTEESSSFLAEMEPTRVVVGKGCIYVYIKTEVEGVEVEGADIYSYTGRILAYSNTHSLMFMNSTGTIKLHNGTEVLDWNGKPTELPFELNGDVYKVTDDIFYCVKEDGLYWNNQYLDFKPDHVKPCTFDGYDGILTERGIYFGPGWKEYLDISNPIIQGVLKADWKTGYGLLTSDGTDTYVESFVPDTELQFPNTLFYEYLSAAMAVMYTLKMGADVNSVAQVLEAIEYQMMDSMDNSGDYPTIVNVY